MRLLETVVWWPMMSLVLACGDRESTACEDADRVEAEIRHQAEQDGLSTRGLCVAADEGLLEDQVGAKRAEEYGAACQKFDKLTAECNDD